MTIDIGDVMENKTDNIESKIISSGNGSGSILAAARKKQNKSVEDIASELNLSITQIKTIELDQNEGLPEPTYVRGYIRSYAKLLGLDAEQVLESYLNPNWQKTSSLDDMPKGIANADDVSRGGFLTIGKIITVLIILSVIGLLWVSGILSKLPASISGSVSGTENSQTKVQLESNLNTELETSRNVIPSVSEAPVTQRNLNQDVDLQTEDGEPVAGTQAQEVQVSETVNSEIADTQNIAIHNLTLKFIETCWVDIRDSDDKRLAYKSYYAGDELSVSNDKRLNVFLGNADGVTAIYNGENFDMSSYREGVYAKFSLTK